MTTNKEQNQLIQMFPIGDEPLTSTKTPIIQLHRTVDALCLKPTYLCNADCDYCYTPPTNNHKWTVDSFKRMFDTIEPVLKHNCKITWHGGEPMLMSPTFYDECCDYIKSKLNNPVILIHSNITKYTSPKWKDVVEKHFGSFVITSYDADEEHRSIKGNPKLYADRFKNSLNQILNDGFAIQIVTVLDNNNKHSVNKFIDYMVATDAGRGKVSIAVDTIEPVGRKEDDGSILTNEENAELLIDVLKRWNDEKIPMSIEPLFTLLQGFFTTTTLSRCGMCERCGKSTLLLDNNGDVSVCEELIDISDYYIYGNANTNTITEILTSQPCRDVISREYNVPLECRRCDAFRICRGGCLNFALKNGGTIDSKDSRCGMFKILFAAFTEMDSRGELEWCKKLVINDMGESFHMAHHVIA